MRFAALAIALLLGACAGAPREPVTVSSVRLVGDRDFVEWRLSSDGAATHDASGRHLQFTAPAELTRPIIADARALAALGSFDCPEAPSDMPDRYVVIQQGGETARTQFQHGCGDVEAVRLANAFFNAGENLRIEGIVIANRAPLVATSIEVRNLTWGRAHSWWRVTRGGEGAYFRDGVEQRFHVSAETYDNIYAIMRPWQGSGISCANAPTDGAYGEITFAVDEDTRRSGWRLGCSSANSDDLYRRLSEATVVVRTLAGVPAATP